MQSRKWMGGALGIAVVLVAASAAEAGQVTAKVKAGDLRIRPSGPGPLQLEIESLGGGTFVVRALDENSAVNGRDEETFENVFGDLSIRTTDADDLVRVFAAPNGGSVLRLPGTLTIDTKGGNDLVELISLRVDDEVRIDSGAGDDGLIVDFFNDTATTEIYTRDGDDSVTMQNCPLTDDLFVTTGRGADTVTVTDCSVGDDVRMAFGKGDDLFTLRRTPVVDLLKVRGGSGIDDMLIDGSSANVLRLACGADRDFVTLQGTSSFGQSRFDGGSGSDTLVEDGTTVFNADPVVRRFETSDLPRDDRTTAGTVDPL